MGSGSPFYQKKSVEKEMLSYYCLFHPYKIISHFMKEKKIVPNYKSLYITNETFNVIFPIIPLFVLHK
jgi:hypothetical protein